MASEWTQDELQAAGEMLYDLAWADEEERFRPKRENWVPRVLAGETPIRTDAVVELACQWKRALAALEAIVPPGDDWWCPTCKQALDGAHVTNQECCDTCGTYLAGINSPEWVEQANAAIAACKKGDVR